MTGPSEKTSYELPNIPLSRSILNDLVLDCEEQKPPPGNFKNISSLNLEGSSSLHVEHKASLGQAHSSKDSKGPKTGGVMLYSSLFASPEVKPKDSPNLTKISLKKLNLNSPSNPPGNKLLVGKEIDNGRNSPPVDGLAYSFVSSNKFKLETQVIPLGNYDQIAGGLRDEADGPSQELSISPTKVKRTPFNQLRNLLRSSSNSDYPQSLRDLLENDGTTTGCFKVLRIKNPLQFKKITESKPLTDHNRLGLLTLDEIFVARLPKEVSGLFKYGALLESGTLNLQPGGNLNLSLLKNSILCGFNNTPIDPASLAQEDKEHYDTIFQILPSVCPGFRKCEGAVSIKTFRDHYNTMKSAMIGIIKWEMRIIGAIRMGHLFQIDRKASEEAVSKKSKSLMCYAKLELRVQEWFNQRWDTLWTTTCHHKIHEELNYVFEGDQLASTLERPSEMKRLKLQVLAYRTLDSGDHTVLEEKSIIPCFCLPGYSTIYFDTASSGHLVVHVTINPVQSSS